MYCSKYDCDDADRYYETLTEAIGGIETNRLGNLHVEPL